MTKRTTRTELLSGKDTPSVFDIRMPPERHVVREARRIASQGGRISELTVCVAQDPVIVLEILYVVNSLTKLRLPSPVTTIQNAVVHLGSHRVINVIDDLCQRPEVDPERMFRAFEALRSQAKKTSMIARILAMATNKELADEAQVVALMANLGLMLGCLNMGSRFVDMAGNLSRAKFLYNLAVEESFDVRSVQLQYLSRFGIPEGLLSVIDPTAATNDKSRMTLKVIVDSAQEMVDADAEDKWYRFKPGSLSSTNSTVGLLEMSEQQYRKVYDRCSQYFIVSKEEDARREQAETLTDDFGSKTFSSLERQWSLQDGLTSISRASELERVVEEVEAEQWPIDTELESEPSRPILDYSAETRRLSQSFDRMLLTAETSEDLLEMLLYFLITEAPFVRAALLIFSEDTFSVRVHRAVGDLEAGTEIKLSDPLSPIVLGLTRVRSFNAPGVVDLVSPIGVPSYAIARLTVSHEKPVVLYADCGREGSLTFEARRVFRYVVDMLNEKLPELPGGLPPGM